MAIDFTSMGGLSAPVEVAPSANGISLNLEKNNILDLSKAAPGLKHVILGAGWDVAQSGTDFDLDVSAFLLNENGKITSGSDVIFYNNMSAPGIHLSGDNRTGVGDGDDETIDIDLGSLLPSVHAVVCCVTIHEAVSRRQTFGMVNSSYIRLVNAETGAEIARYTLKDDYSTSTAVIFAKLVKNGSSWAMQTIGEGKQADLNGIANLFA